MEHKFVDIKPFSYESGQDVTIFLKRYERSVDAHLAADATAAQKKSAYLRILPTKLDDFSLTLYESSENNDDWEALKAEFIQKFTDPSKAQTFKSKLDFIKWDGESPLSIYENRIISATRQYDPDVVANEDLFNREVFKRFIAGLPPDYQHYVDAGMPVRSTDVTMARERAEKFKDILSRNNGTSPYTGLLNSKLPLSAALAVPPVLAAFKNPVVDNLTDQISALSLAHKESLAMQKETNKSINSLIEHLSTQSGTERRSRAYSPGGRSNFTPAYGQRSPHGSPFRSPNRNGQDFNRRPPSFDRNYPPQQPYPSHNSQHHNQPYHPSPSYQPNQPVSPHRPYQQGGQSYHRNNLPFQQSGQPYQQSHHQTNQHSYQNQQYRPSSQSYQQGNQHYRQDGQNSSNHQTSRPYQPNQFRNQHQQGQQQPQQPPPQQPPPPPHSGSSSRNLGASGQMQNRGSSQNFNGFGPMPEPNGPPYYNNIDHNLTTPMLPPKSVSFNMPADENHSAHYAQQCEPPIFAHHEDF